MANLEQMNIHLEGIGHALGDLRLRVPPYQRSYAWQERNVIDLIDDIRGAFTTNEGEYFLGAVVVSEDDDAVREVVDGQQRLATTMILIAAIRDYFADSGDNARAKDIERDFLLSRDRKTQDETARLTLSAADHDFFLNRILRRQERRAERPSHDRLIQVSELAKRRVDALARSVNNPADHLLRWLDYIEHRARVIWVEVPGHANAFVVFETLNDRGLGLSAADLLKNYLFSLAGDRIEEVQEYWTRMLGALEAVAEDDAVVNYIRHYWSSSVSPARTRELYTTIKKATTSKNAAVEIASELQSHAELYAALLNSQHPKWDEIGPHAKEYIETLHLLRMEQNRPLLLAVLRSFTPKEIAETLQLIVSWSARFLVVGGLGGGTMEKHYSERAVEVRRGDVDSAKGLAKAMAGVVPTDTQFRASFATARVSQAWLARYYLRALEKTARGESEPELVPNPNEEQVNLEHVLPQTPNQNWQSIDPDTARAVHKRLGNLALQSRKSNTLGGNASFQDKKPIIAESNFLLTRSIADYGDWTPDEIDERQQWLADLAVKTWRV